jgi:cytochrome b involved in lipid metabolism
MIMRDTVIDVGPYLRMGSHPGGIFVMDKNIGRDISKYIDGGYSMECNVAPKYHSY